MIDLNKIKVANLSKINTSDSKNTSTNTLYDELKNMIYYLRHENYYIILLDKEKFYNWSNKRFSINLLKSEIDNFIKDNLTVVKKEDVKNKKFSSLVTLLELNNYKDNSVSNYKLPMILKDDLKKLNFKKTNISEKQIKTNLLSNIDYIVVPKKVNIKGSSFFDYKLMNYYYQNDKDISLNELLSDMIDIENCLNKGSIIINSYHKSNDVYKKLGHISPIYKYEKVGNYVKFTMNDIYQKIVAKEKISFYNGLEIFAKKLKDLEVEFSIHENNASEIFYYKYLIPFDMNNYNLYDIITSYYIDEYLKEREKSTLRYIHPDYYNTYFSMLSNSKIRYSSRFSVIEDHKDKHTIIASIRDAINNTPRFSNEELKKLNIGFEVLDSGQFVYSAYNIGLNYSQNKNIDKTINKWIKTLMFYKLPKVPCITNLNVIDISCENKYDYSFAEVKQINDSKTYNDVQKRDAMLKYMFGVKKTPVNNFMLSHTFVMLSALNNINTINDKMKYFSGPITKYLKENEDYIYNFTSSRISKFIKDLYKTNKAIDGLLKIEGTDKKNIMTLIVLYLTYIAGNGSEDYKKRIFKEAAKKMKEMYNNCKKEKTTDFNYSFVSKNFYFTFNNYYNFNTTKILTFLLD